MKKFFSKQNTRNRILINYFLLLVIFVSGLAYAFNVNSTVMYVVEKREYVRDIAELNTEVAELEYEYTAIKNQLTPLLAEGYGLGEASRVVFVKRVPTTEGLTINTLQNTLE